MKRSLPVLVLAIVAGILTVPATYALLRGYDVIFKNEPNPATVIFSAKIAMFWRVGIGSYAGGMVAFATYFAAVKRIELVVRAVSIAAVVVAAMIGLQGLLLP